MHHISTGFVCPIILWLFCSIGHWSNWPAQREGREREGREREEREREEREREREEGGREERLLKK